MRVPTIHTNSNFFPSTKTLVNVGEISDETSQRLQVDLTDEKDRIAFIKRAEKLIRNSMEYKEFVDYLKTYVDMRECAYFENVNNYDSRNVKIEIHHVPFTLFDIVDTVLRKRAANGKSLSLLEICNEVMAIHFMGQVGLIPLASTVHALVHSNKIAIPLNKIFGDHTKFYSIYGDFMSAELKDSYLSVVENDKATPDTPPDILKLKYVEVNMLNIGKPMKMETEVE